MKQIKKEFKDTRKKSVVFVKKQSMLENQEKGILYLRETRRIRSKNKQQKTIQRHKELINKAF